LRLGARLNPIYHKGNQMQACHKPILKYPAAMLLLAGMLAFGAAGAREGQSSQAHALDARRVASALQVKGNIAAPPAGVADLKFREFFKMPIGPLGLEPTDKLLGLNGKRVRIFGYMVNAEEPSPGPFILAPLAVSMAEKEDGPADDMPATTVFVHINNAEDRLVPHVPGLLKLTGILSLGGQEEPDGRVSAVRLLVDPELSKSLLGKNPPGRAKH